KRFFFPFECLADILDGREWRENMVSRSTCPELASRQVLREIVLCAFLILLCCLTVHDKRTGLDAQAGADDKVVLPCRQLGDIKAGLRSFKNIPCPMVHKQAAGSV